MNEVKAMMKRIYRALLFLSCILLLSAACGCSHETPRQENGGSKAPTTQSVVTDPHDETSGAATDSLPESETAIQESQTEDNGSEGTDTDQSASADSGESSDRDTDSPKDPNQGEWDPQP